MKRFISALTFCSLLLVLLSFFLFPRVSAKDDPILVLLNLPAPAPPNPDVRHWGVERNPKFYDRNSPPKDEASIGDLLDYWLQQTNAGGLEYRPEPSDRVRQRIMDEIRRNPKMLPSYLHLIDADTSGDFVKRVYDDESLHLDKDARSLIKNWLTNNTSYFSSELEAAANDVTDVNGYVSSQDELLALAHVDFQKASPVLNRLYGDPSNPVSQTLAKRALYKHALDTNSLGDTERYRDELKAVVEDTNALPGMRDLALDALVKEKEWSGRDEWYYSLLGDETLAELRVNGTTYTGLTTIILVSPDEKYIDKMLELVKNGNAIVRAAAIRNLVLKLNAGRPDVVKALVPWLEDAGWAIDRSDSRGALVRVLGEVKVPESVPGLIKMLDESRSVESSDGAYIVSNTALTANMAASMNAAVANANSRSSSGNSNSAVSKMPAFYTYPYRSSAVTALAMQKDQRAVPALRRILPAAEDYERNTIVKAILDCNGFTTAEQLDALDAAIKAQASLTDGEVPAGFNSNAKPRTVTAAEIKSILGQQLMQATEVSDQLAHAVVDRIDYMETRDAKLSAAYRRAVLKWQNAVINLMLLRDLKNGSAGADGIIRLLSQRQELREKQPSDVFAVQSGKPTAIGIAACILENTNNYSDILEGGDAEAKAALLACARLLRAPLPVSKVTEHLSSKDPVLALASERYLEVEDSPAARAAVLARHPGEAKIMGATTAFNSGNEAESEFLWMLYQSLGDNSLYNGWDGSGNDDELKNIERRLQDEVKTNDELLGVYAYDKNYVRFYKDKAVYSWDEDDSRYRERPLNKEEADEIKSYMAAQKADQLPPFVSCGGGYCEAKELVMLGRNGGRRVYVNGGQSPWGDSYPFFDGLENYFARLRQTRATLKYGLSRDLPGLEILIASDSLRAETVWKSGNDLLVAASDVETRKKVKTETGADTETEDYNPEEEQKRSAMADKRRWEGYAWYKVADGETAGPVSQPADVEFIPPQNDAKVAAQQGRWKARAGDVEIRASDEGLFKLTRGRVTNLGIGSYSSPVITPTGRWLLVSKVNESGSGVLERVNLLTNREYPIPIEGYGNRYPVAYLPTLNKVLVVQDYYGYGDEAGEASDEYSAPSEADPSSMLLVDPATGSAQPVTGEFRPLAQQTFRPLQRTGRPNEFWAAISEAESNQTEVGLYDTNHFGFRRVLKIPKIMFNSMNMWVDEPGAKVYFVYRGHLLSLPLPK